MGEPIRVEVRGGGEERRGGSATGALTMVPGLALIAFGVALFVWPALLRYLVAGTFVLAGLGLLIAARKIGRMRRKMSSFQSSFTDFGGPGGPMG